MQVGDLVNAVQEELGDTSPTWADLEAVCQSDWRFPGEADLAFTRTVAYNVFSKKKISQDGTPRVSASEALLAPYLVRYFVQRTVCALDGAVVQRIRRQIDSVLATCSVALAGRGCDACPRTPPRGSWREVR